MVPEGCAVWQAAELARTQEATAEVLRQGEAGVQRREKALRQREGVVAAAERKVAAAARRQAVESRSLPQPLPQSQAAAPDQMRVRGEDRAAAGPEPAEPVAESLAVEGSVAAAARQREPATPFGVRDGNARHQPGRPNPESNPAAHADATDDTQLRKRLQAFGLGTTVVDW